MAWTSRHKAAAFSIALLTVSTAFVVTAAASTEGALAPFLQGSDFARERPLSRHGSALGLLVTGAGPEGLARAAGAQATLQRVDGGDSVERATNERGIAVFHARPAEYRLSVEWQGHEAERAVDLSRNLRLGLYFDEAGQGHWLEKEHRELERRGEAAPLSVRVQTGQEGAVTPVAGADVDVYRWADGSRQELVASATTNQRGMALLDLHRGGYEVVVEHDGQSLSQILRHTEPRRLVFSFGDGVERADAEPTQRR